MRTAKSRKKGSKYGEIEIFNTELTYSCGMHFQSLERITLEDVLKYDWPPIVLSLSENVGEMRASKSKSDLKKNTSSVDVFTLTTKA